jgi:hypothetical protein
VTARQSPCPPDPRSTDSATRRYPEDPFDFVFGFISLSSQWHDLLLKKPLDPTDDLHHPVVFASNNIVLPSRQPGQRTGTSQLQRCTYICRYVSAESCISS